jgi:hypothetical protein
MLQGGTLHVTRRHGTLGTLGGEDLYSGLVRLDEVLEVLDAPLQHRVVTH